MQRVPEPEYMDLTEEADAYGRADFSEVNTAFVNRLLSFALNTKSPLVLDLGVGPGDIPLRILAEKPHWHIVGLDAARAMLLIAREARAYADPTRQLSLTLADAKTLPFPENTFDAVISNSILHHVSEPTDLWKEIGRAAKPGALIFVRDLYRPESTEAAKALVQHHAGNESALLQEEFYRSLLAAYTVEEVKEQLATAGLSGLTVAQVTNRHLDVFGNVTA